jgi:hypothetical protein
MSVIEAVTAIIPIVANFTSARRRGGRCRPHSGLRAPQFAPQKAVPHLSQNMILPG